MEINSLKFGKIKIDSKKVITFKDSIIGFDQVNQYVLIDVNQGSPLKWLHAVNEPSPCFLVTDPYLFMPGYEVDVSPQDLLRVECKRREELGIIVVVTILEEGKKITANLRGPVIINFKNRLAKQVVLLDDHYSISHSVGLLPSPREEHHSCEAGSCG